jgi:hypothetical protein
MRWKKEVLKSDSIYFSLTQFIFIQCKKERKKKTWEKERKKKVKCWVVSGEMWCNKWINFCGVMLLYDLLGYTMAIYSSIIQKKQGSKG